MTLTIREEFKKAHPKIAEKLESSEYDFLRTDPHLRNRIILLGLGGSHAYGLATPTSDLDIRGIALNSKEEILGTKVFEQFENRATDTVVYGLKKIFNLLAACNPNVIEILGLRDEDYAIITPEGQKLLDNRRVFLSRKAAKSFGGYANAQLRRIQTATARDRLPELIRQKFIQSSIDNAIENIHNVHGLDQYGQINLHVDDVSEQILADVDYKNLPLGEFIDLINTLKQVRDDYNKTAGNRNHKKDDLHLNKHASHLIRLYHMGCELLEKGEINTYRAADHNLLMGIKNGQYMDSDGLFMPEFYELVDNLEKRLECLKESSPLPVRPDQEAIEKLLMEMNEAALKR